ncbi:MAG: hypothetical protein HC851_24875 [Acaryochloris sp. RU_4_1]|nr:hypothetical protein [Acaryochloris sp. RU_4_1]NJR55487.1 hypothetical protein [Acaryochloris sp. CRU_2_0]
MTQHLPPPALDQIHQRAAKVQEICQQADEGVLMLDELIAQLEEQIRSSFVYRYRLKLSPELEH